VMRAARRRSTVERRTSCEWDLAGIVFRTFACRTQRPARRAPTVRRVEKSRARANGNAAAPECIAALSKLLQQSGGSVTRHCLAVPRRTCCGFRAGPRKALPTSLPAPRPGPRENSPRGDVSALLTKALAGF
jgi:hypothetical protein